MCLITFAYRKHPDYQLILVANRDELYGRPSQPAQYWSDQPHIIAGRDLQAGGSWLGITEQGRFAAVTNFREGIVEPSELSRGDLVVDFLGSQQLPQQFSDALLDDQHRYGGYNLLLSTANELFYTSNRSDLATALSPGYYSLSNHLLDTPWPKATYAKQALQQLLSHRSPDIGELIALMQHQQPFDDHLLPATGIGLEKERTLSPPFFATPEYGTRCTSVILWPYQGDIVFVEQNYLPQGTMGDYREFRIPQ